MSVLHPHAAQLRQLVSLQTAVSNADAEALMLSRKTCHASNVASIVLANRTGNMLLRAYIATPGHRLGDQHNQGHRFTVGVHNHRYDLFLSSVMGKVRNDLYQVSSEGMPTRCYRVDPDTGARIADGQVKLECRASQDLNSGFIPMSGHELHAVVVNSPYAAWVVSEGNKYPGELALYNNASPEPAPTEHFESASEVVSFVDKFVRDATKWLTNEGSQSSLLKSHMHKEEH